MDRISGYSSVCALGHRSIADILSGVVTVEEKIDGSQFSFALGDGGMIFRSKGAIIYPEAPQAMFKGAVETAISIKDKLTPNWVYRGEVLCKPKHNTLVYSRVPTGNIIIFDIDRADQDYLPYTEKKAECERIGLECVPLLDEGVITTKERLIALLAQDSILGGTKIEGMVIKNYALFTTDKKTAMAKIVQEGFQEVNSGEWRKANPTKQDIIETLITKYRVPARWQKSVQHLKEKDCLTDSPKDIGNLIKEAIEDVKKEEEAVIKDALFAHFWKDIARGLTHGLPEWYKQKLLDDAFVVDEDNEPMP